jgi:hypothetical protein
VTGESTTSTGEQALPRPVGPAVLGWRLWKVPSRDPTADAEIVLALLGLLAFLVMGLVPLEWVVPWLGGCRFHDMTGHPCPTCGITRGVLAVSEGNLLGGLRQNPLIVGVLLAGMAYTPFAWWFWLAGRPRWRLSSTSRRARIAWAIAGAAALFGNWLFLVLDGR